MVIIAKEKKYGMVELIGNVDCKTATFKSDVMSIN